MTVRSEERPTPWRCAHCGEEVEAGVPHICPAQFAEPWLLGRLAALEREVAALAARLAALEEKREGGGERPE